MADIRRVVRLSSGGRPQTILDLESSSSGIASIAQSFKVTPGARNTQMVESSSRYGGQRATDESHGNGTVSSSFYVNATTADIAAARVESLLQQVEFANPSEPHYIEWRPHGTSNSILYEIRGPGSWTPNYDARMFEANRTFPIDITWPVAPLAQGLPMDIHDNPVTESAITDYAAVGGSNLGVWVPGGYSLPGDSSTIIHTARGYTYGDTEVAAQFTLGTLFGNTEFGVVLRYIDANNHIFARVTPNNLSIFKVDNGGIAGISDSPGFVPVNGQNYWIVLRIEGNNFQAEAWTNGVNPTPTTFPAATTGVGTFTGGDATKFGAGAVGQTGIRVALQGQPANWFLKQFVARPYTYKNKTTPTVLTLQGAVPGSAPAKVDTEIATTGGTVAPVWALLGSKPTNTNVSMLIQAENYYSIGGWATAADANSSNGNHLTLTTTNAVAGIAAVTWLFSPQALPADVLGSGDIDLNIYVRGEIGSTLVTPKLTAKIGATGTGGVFSFASPFGSAGKLLTVPSSGSQKRVWGLGTLNIQPNWKNPQPQLIRIDASWAAGAPGVFALDYLMLVPSRWSTSGPTRQINDFVYPRFTVSTAETLRLIETTGRGWLAQPPSIGLVPHPGLPGPIEFRPGSNEALVKLSSLVPDDPTLDATNEQLNHTASVHFSVTPRYNLIRGA